MVEHITLNNIPLPENKKLLPFQKTGVQFMSKCLRSDIKGCYLADEMGLGKTIQTIALCNALGFSRVLIICPKVVRSVWEQEVLNWGMKVKAFTITHYEYVRTHHAEFKERFDCLVLDEAHRVKNQKAQITKVVLGKIWNLCEHHIALSGTPFTNQVTDLFTLLNKFMPQIFPDFYGFANDFAYRKQTPWGVKWEGLKNAEILRNILRSRCYLRRIKQDVLPELPAKQFQKIMLPNEHEDMSQDDKKEHDEYVAALRAYFASGKATRPPVPGKSVMTRRRIEGLKKVPIVFEFVKDLLDNSIPVVLFSWFRDTIAEFERIFEKYKPAVIHGATGQDERHDAIKDFQESRTDLFLGTLAAAGIGVTLNRASTVVLAELDYTPSTISQAVDRVHRIGQKGHVMVYYFVTEHSIDENICEALIEKSTNFKSLMDTNDEREIKREISRRLPQTEATE